MTMSVNERRARAGLPFIRFLQAWVPLSLSRWLNQQGAALVRLEADVKRAAVSADGVPCEWIIPQNSPADQALIYLHGGGFVMGVSPPHLQMVAYLARKLGRRALMVDYRLAPDYPFPAALDDCVTAYLWLLKQDVSAPDIAVAGDSAGGNLTLTTLMKLRDSGDPLPAAAACLSPVADLTKIDQARKGFKDPLLPAKAARFYTRSYVRRNDAHNPLISPVFGDWRGLPPLLVHAGEDEILRDDAVCIEALAKAAGVDVRLEVYPRMWHVWQIFLTLPQATQSLDDIAQFLKAHMRCGVAQPSPA
jgi:epsilon-lactone hydrolase